MPDRTAYALTEAQRQNLALLGAAGAISAETSINVHSAGASRLNPNVLGILVDKRLVEKKVRQGMMGGRCMHYWLTADGAVKASMG